MTAADAMSTATSRRLGGALVGGLLATLAAVAATTLVAALARAAGVDFEIPEGGEAIPLSGFAVVTGVLCVVGVAIAVALSRWSSRPAERFVWTAMTLTAVSLIAPLLSGGDAATVCTLVGLHLVPAAVMVPALGRSLGGGTARRRGTRTDHAPADRPR